MRFLLSLCAFFLVVAYVQPTTPLSASNENTPITEASRSSDFEAALRLSLAFSQGPKVGCDCSVSAICDCAVCDCAIPIASVTSVSTTNIPSVVQPLVTVTAYEAARARAVSASRPFVVGVGVEPPKVLNAVVFKAENLQGAKIGDVVWAVPYQGDLIWQKTTTQDGTVTWQPQPPTTQPTQQPIQYYSSFNGNGSGCSGGSAGVSYISYQQPRLFGGGLFGGGGCAGGICP